jgi:hypothetical protein
MVELQRLTLMGEPLRDLDAKLKDLELNRGGTVELFVVKPDPDVRFFENNSKICNPSYRSHRNLSRF